MPGRNSGSCWTRLGRHAQRPRALRFWGESGARPAAGPVHPAPNGDRGIYGRTPEETPTLLRRLRDGATAPRRMDHSNAPRRFFYPTNYIALGGFTTPRWARPWARRSSRRLGQPATAGSYGQPGTGDRRALGLRVVALIHNDSAYGDHSRTSAAGHEDTLSRVTSITPTSSPGRSHGSRPARPHARIGRSLRTALETPAPPSRGAERVADRSGSDGVFYPSRIDATLDIKDHRQRIKASALLCRTTTVDPVAKCNGPVLELVLEVGRSRRGGRAARRCIGRPGRGSRKARSRSGR